MPLASKVAAALAIAAGVGVLDGGVSRLLMRGVALATVQDPAFSVVATLGIMLVFGVTALPLALTTKLTTQHTARVVAGAAGTVVLAFFAVNIGLQEVTNAHDLPVLHWLGLFASMAGLAAVVLAQPWVILRSARAGGTRPTRAPLA
jgi:hypothetical protein